MTLPSLQSVSVILCERCQVGKAALGLTPLDLGGRIRRTYSKLGWLISRVERAGALLPFRNGRSPDVRRPIEKRRGRSTVVEPQVCLRRKSQSPTALEV